METEILPVPNSHHIPSDAHTEPEEDWKRGRCPVCGDWLVSNLYFTKYGYILRWQCWSSLKRPDPTCDYSRVL